MICGAKKCKGVGRCRAHAVPGKRRCIYHGGLSTGPRDWRGNVEAMGIAHARKAAELRALGLKWPGGRPKGRWAWKAKNEVEMAKRLIEDQLELLPAVGKPAEQMTMPELLHDGARLGLLRQHQILSRTLEPDDLKGLRLQLDAAANVTKLYARVSEAQMRVQGGGDAVSELADRLRAVERSQLKPAKKVSGND